MLNEKIKDLLEAYHFEKTEILNQANEGLISFIEIADRLVMNKQIIKDLEQLKSLADKEILR